MTRDTDIARIAAMLRKTLLAMTDYSARSMAAKLYDAGLRPSVEPAGLGARFHCAGCDTHDWTPEEIAADRALLPTQASDSLEPFDEADNMCPNCITPWKCNGPHLSEQTAAGLRHSAASDS